MNNKPTNELEWLFYNLWLKTGPAPPQFIFTIAETIFYRVNDQGNYSISDVSIPDSWYFTSKDGYILKKNKFNVSTKEIHKTFCKKLEPHDQVAAVAFYQQQNILNESVDIHVQYLPPTDFKAHLFYNSDSSSSKKGYQLYALQKFVQCKSIKHTIFKCAWSLGTLPIIEKLQNVNSFFDSKVQLSERTPTFETNCELISTLEKGSVPQQVTDNIIRSIKQITSHIQDNTRVDLQSGVFYFKIDKKTDVLYLIFATNLQLASSAQQSSHKALLGNKTECRIFNYQRKAQFDVSSIHQSFEQQQPIVNIVPNLKQSTKNRPYTGRQGSKITENQCPFCEKTLVNEGEELSFEITVNQVLKFHKKLNINIDLKFSQTRFIQSIQYVNDKKLPLALGRAFPKLNEIKLQRQKQDPEFLYDCLKMCEECYLSYKEVLQNVSKKQGKNRDLDLTNDQGSNSQASYSVRNIETKSGHKSSIQDFTLPMLYPKNSLNLQVADIQRNSNQQDSKTGEFNTEKKVQEIKATEDNRSSADLKSISQSVYAKITGLDEKSRQLLHEQSKSRLSQISKESNKEEQKQPMFMMFSKVEAGKEVSDALVKIKRDSSSDHIKVIEKIEQASKQKEDEPIQMKSRGRMIGQRLSNKSERTDEINEEAHSQNKRKSQQNLLGRQYSKGRKENLMAKNNSQVQKLEWQKSYQESIKAKTREIKNQILETCDKIESGEFSQPLLSKQENSEVGQILNFYKPNNNLSHAQILTINGKKSEQAQVVHESRMFENITPIIFDIDTQQSERIVSLKKRRGQPNQPNNVRQQLPIPIKIESKRKTLIEKVESTSPTERRPSQKQRLMTAYGMGNFPKYALIPAQKSLNRQRPQSSKPPLHQTYNTTTHQSNTINQRGDSVEPIDDERVNAKKKQRPQTHKSVRPKPAQQLQNPTTTNLLDFNNMSEEHIKEIANKADQLIEIIQNIKDKVGGKQPEMNLKEFDMIEQNKDSDSWW